jgi:hypothetical protein
VMRYLALAAAAVLLGTLASPAASLPRYASREGDVCQTCHVDPNGGGIRNEFGFSYGKNRHSTEPEARWSSLTVNPKLNDWITFGVDFRMLYVASHSNGDSRTLSTSTLFPMEGQVNLMVMPHEHLTFVASHGLVVDEPGFPTGYVSREIYGMFEGLPGDVYVQAGRFRLPFGLRQDDHTSFVRGPEFLPYDSQKPAAGIEIGHIGNQLFQQLSFTNGPDAFLDRAQTFTGKVGIATRSVQLAVSGFHRYAENLPGRFDRWGIYASSTRGRVTLLAEAAAGTNALSATTTNLEAMFVELEYRLSRGVSTRTKFDWVDRNRDQPGFWSRRLTGELEWTPVPFAIGRLSYRYNEGSGRPYHEYLAQLYVPF